MESNPSPLRLLFLRGLLLGCCAVLLLVAIIIPSIATGSVQTNEPVSQAVSPTNVAPSRPRAHGLLQRGIAEDAYRQKASRAAEHARRVQAEVNETLAAADAEHARVNAEQNPPPPPPRLVERNPGLLLFGFVVVLFGVVSKLALDRHAEYAEIRALSGGYLSDGTEVAKFVMPDLFAPEAKVSPLHDTWETKPSATETAAPEKDPVAEFIGEAPKLIERLSESLKRVNAAPAGEDRQAAFSALDTMLGEIAERTKPWALRPAWQVSTGLRLLVSRVWEKPKDVTSSVLRTIAAGIDVLRDVCVPHIRANLLIEPALRILAADDDPLCRRAVAFALQKAGLSADFAENGKVAVELAERTAYDMIFLDIQMPEMDGLTACTRIRESKTNAHTPVVFVTVQNDFQTRVQTTAIGSAELLAKPFLVFELTVKALICATRKRLALLASASPAATPVGVTNKAKVDTVASGGKRPSDATTSETAALKEHFFDSVGDYITSTLGLLRDVRSSLDEGGALATTLSKLHVRVVTLAAAAKVNKLPKTERAASAIEALVRKLQGDTKYVTESSLHTLENAIALLARICSKGIERKLSSRPARILVVEDEPLSRRAVVGALQLAFERPDSAPDGETALKMAQKKRYDVVFTDIEMPRMDGFALCRELRQDRLNAETPVVFITNHSQPESRSQADDVGGTDFISKPFIPIEITVKALTLAFQHRLKSAELPAVSRPQLEMV